MTLTTRCYEQVNCLEDLDGHAVATFDLRSIDISPTIASALLRAHAREFGHNAIETQRQAFRCLRKLVLCLQECELQHAQYLPSDIPIRVHRWLRDSGLMGSTAQSHQAIIITLLRWCHRNTSVISGVPNFIVPSFKRDIPTTGVKLSAEEQDEILQICFESIQNSEELLALYWEEVRSEEGSQRASTAGIAAELLRRGKGLLPTQNELLKYGSGLYKKTQVHGGLSVMRSCLYITFETLFPYYLAILILTASNPHALRNIGIDCIRRHPLRSDMESLIWDKPRSGREQRLDFPVDREWSGPGLVRRLLHLTEPLRQNAPAAHKQSLFIAMSLKGGVSVPSVQTLHDLLAVFIKTHALRDFDFKDCRASVATRVHIESGSMDSARRLLNHRSIRTTSRYISTDDLSKKNDRAIQNYQGQLVLGPLKEVDKQGSSDMGARASPTVFGFVCADPYDGINPQVQKGNLCTQFHGCATCPGALIPLDDIEVIGRILGAHKVLLEARDAALKTGRWARFRDQYKPTLDVLEKEILPMVDERVLRLAASRTMAHAIPFIE